MTESKQKSFVERGLGLFTEVNAGEGATVLLMTAISFLILTSYYLLKPTREALILSLKGGAELKTYARLGMIRKAKVAENATDYSLGNTVKNVLFLTVSREDKYKAKQSRRLIRFLSVWEMFSLQRLCLLVPIGSS